MGNKVGNKVGNKQLMTWILLGMLSLTVTGCWWRNNAAGVDDDPLVEELPPALEEPADPQGPGSTPTTSPTPAPPEPGVGGTGTAINPPQAALLIAQQPGAQINLRSQPTTSSTAKGYGLVGDSVQLLRSAAGSDGTWYYVKFEESGAEGWVRGDFINTAGRPTPLSPQASASSTCEGLMEAMTFIAFYDASGFNQVRFTNLETRNTFDGRLSREGSNNQGQPLYRGTMSPPTGGSYAVELTDLSGGTPRSGSQVAVSYEGIEGTGTCK